MVADGLGVAALRVSPPPARVKLGGGGWGPAMEPSCPQCRGTEPQTPGETERRGMPAAEQSDHPIQVVDVDIAAHIGATEPELAWGAQKVADRPR